MTVNEHFNPICLNINIYWISSHFFYLFLLIGYDMFQMFVGITNGEESLTKNVDLFSCQYTKKFVGKIQVFYY